MYFPGVPMQDQDKVPLVVLMLVATTVIVTACPVLVLAVDPETTIVPAVSTSAADTLPATLIVTFTPMLALFDGSVWNFSVIAVRALEAARISSETLARTV